LFFLIQPSHQLQQPDSVNMLVWPCCSSCSWDRSVAQESQDAWQKLVQTNPDPRPALSLAEIRADRTGRRYYAGLALWLDPARPPSTGQ
jgi:hypothetical protein